MRGVESLLWRRAGRGSWRSASVLHGFGFAGALAEVGLPHHAIPIALLFFNLGVEIGQLAFVAAVVTVGGLFRRAMALRLEPYPYSANSQLDPRDCGVRDWHSGSLSAG